MLALHHASTFLAAQTAEPDAVLDEVLHSALTLLHGAAAALYQWDAAAGLLHCVRNFGPGFDDGAVDVHPGQGLAG